MNWILLFDVLLIAALLLVSWRLLGASDLFQATVLFIAFGLFLAVAWIRLQAPDIALAEAAVGAGLAGVLLFGTFKRIEPGPAPEKGGAFSESCRLDPTSPCPGRVQRLLTFTFVMSLTALLVAAVLDLPHAGNGLTQVVGRSLAQSGVEHSVTAVLLNFRFYDTWLELSVLLLAVLNILCVRGRHDLRGMGALTSSGPVLPHLVGALAPVMSLVVVYLLWLGDHAPGGAFQAGVVLAAVLVLFWLSGQASMTHLPRGAWLLSVICGFGSILLMAVITSLGPATAPLEYPYRWAGTLILAVESAATWSIGVILASLTVLSLAAGGPQQNGEP